jgi:hypothetical protein
MPDWTYILQTEEIMKRVAVGIVFWMLCMSGSGCMYRGEGIFKKISDSDYKARVNLGVFAVADGRPTYVSGSVLLEDHMTPLKNTHILLRSKEQSAIVSNSYTDHVGRFSMSGILQNDSYIVEIDSQEYLGNKEIVVNANRVNSHDIFAHKK